MTLSTTPNFGALLREYRSAAGLTQEELAALARLSARGISDLERGLRRQPRPATVRLLATALGLPEGAYAALIAAARQQPNPPSRPLTGGPDPRGLPTPATPLLGREREAAAISALIGGAATHLVTLTGPGGVGKTRLARHVMASVEGDYPDGVAFVSLAPLTDPDRVAPAIAQALALKETGDRSSADSLAAYLRERATLLVLDNCEHLPGLAMLVAALLAAAPRLVVLATSRAPLHLSGEQEFPVPPLGLPEAGQAADRATLLHHAAPTLYLQRAAAVRPDFVLTDADAPAVAEICRRLDGLPLAIELAAARVGLLPPRAMLARLDRALPLLTGGARDLPARQQTLRATLDWSYDLLDPGEQQLLARLAPFAGSCTLEAAEAVCGQVGHEGTLGTTQASSAAPFLPTPPHILDHLASLIAKSLVRQVPKRGLSSDEDDAVPRFGLLETVREYAWEQLARLGETTTSRQRHADYFLALAERAEPALWGGAEQRAWLQRLEVEHDNLRAALSWYLDRNEAAPALRMAGALGWFWFLRGHTGEGRHWLEAALAQSDAATPILRAKALTQLGGLAIQRTDLAGGLPIMEEALALWLALGDDRWTAFTLFRLGHLVRDGGDQRRAEELFEASVALSRGHGAAWGIVRAIPLIFLGTMLMGRGEYGRADALLAEGSALGRQLADNVIVAAALQVRGETAHRAGDNVRAVELLEEALALYQSLGHHLGRSNTLYLLASVVLQRGDDAHARRLLRESLTLASERGDGVSMAACLNGLGVAAGKGGRYERAASLFGAASILRATTGPPEIPLVAAYERQVTAGRALLGEMAWAAAWAQGRTLTTEQALTLAQEDATAD